MRKPPLFWHVALCAILCIATAVQAAGAEYPEKPIRWIVPSAAGGVSDATVRVVTAELAKRLGQAFVIDNRPGATGIIGLDAIAKSKPDGYTIGSAALSSIVTGSLVAKNLPYNTSRDFLPIAMLSTQPNLLGVASSLPVKSVKELVAYSQSHPNAIFYGSNGNGSSLHVATELFRASTGLRATHVPYKSTPAAEMDLIAGQLQMLIDNFGTMAPNVQSGRVRALAITGPKRSPLLPDVPTMAEAGVPGAEMVAWTGVVGPSGIPANIIQKLNSEINAVLADPKVVKQLRDLASDPAPMSVGQFDQFLKMETARWSAVIRNNNITAD
ncbi:tripartite tricarboxylate transporter substrate binding protein (plasmid) [Variovorax sp. V213]|uniref:Bug family tripartite tricarboxylate transporter substrate binding protein n=1 Tax=Variovorax sp. V213 TaxID=3065955 RepID=UPI0034E8BF64